jgi:hypothetical protein
MLGWINGYMDGDPGAFVPFPFIAFGGGGSSFGGVYDKYHRLPQAHCEQSTQGTTLENIPELLLPTVVILGAGVWVCGEPQLVPS